MSKPTIGELTDAMFRVREARKNAQAKVDEIKAKEERLSAMLMEALDDQNTRKGEGSMASCSISTSIHPVAKDWDKVFRFMLRHKDLSLLQKRLSPARYRELLEEYPRGVPGLDSFEKRTLNLRKLPN